MSPTNDSAAAAGPTPVVADGPEFRANTYTTTNQKNPKTAMDAAGNFVITWQSQGQDNSPSANDGVFAQRFNAAGVKLGAEFVVNTTLVGNQNHPAIAMDAAGDFVIAWEGQDATGSDVFARRYDAAGTAQGGEFRVNTTTADFQEIPTVAMDSDGDFVVAWQSEYQLGPLALHDIFAQRYRRTGAAVGGEFQVNTTTDDQQRYPTAAMNGAGDLVIAWESSHQDPDNSTGIYAQRYNAAGGALGGEFRVNTITASVQFQPAAAMDADGDFVVTWYGYELNGATGIYGRRFDATGAGRGPDFLASTTVPGYQRYVAVAMDSDGDFVVTWQNEYGDPSLGRTSIDAQRFSAAGARVDGEFRVNTTTLGNHRYPAAAMDADGDFVIAWASYGQDPGDSAFSSGVYAQRYAVPAGAPRATQVYASGTTWTTPFKTYLQGQGLGSGLFGFAIGGGAAELADLPWNNLNQVSVTFGAAVTVAQGNLAVRGVNVANYAVTGFVYDPATHTATWTLGRNIANDKVILDLDGDAATGGVAAAAGGQLLDGEWTTGATFPSGNGAAGGDFRYRFNVLPGNVNRVSSVLADDFSSVKSRFFRSTAAPGSGATAYTIFNDVNGNGSIIADDFSYVKSRFFSSLPGPEPAGVPAGVSPGASPRVRDLADAILAGDDDPPAASA